ncbi:MAG: LON peptidase substrate-binding domain-containing protein, partial [Candidatus Competibacteraceae bacterium]|nr:LON peptidase substrate-binding domain-containing protein [Candidatus Competibacteraceae bacterium]
MSEHPATYPVLPLRNTLLFPHLYMPLSAGRPASVAAVEAALDGEDKTLIVVPQRDPSVEQPGRDELFAVGTLAVIRKMQRGEEGIQVVVQGLQRVEIGEQTQSDPYLTAQGILLPEPTDRGPEVEALRREALELAVQIGQLVDPRAAQAITQIAEQIQDPLHQAYLITSMTGLGLERDRRILAADSCKEALRILVEGLNQERQVAEVRSKIASQTRSGMEKQQREYYLRQQLRAIQEELGEQAPEQAEAAELRRRLEESQLPEAVRKEAERELTRLERMSPQAPDYQMARNYLELVLELPWTRTTEDVLDLFGNLGDGLGGPGVHQLTDLYRQLQGLPAQGLHLRTP